MLRKNLVVSWCVGGISGACEVDASNYYCLSLKDYEVLEIVFWCGIHEKAQITL
ncbi:hypothetical protein [Bartonella acomydis]|uniref:hypothetical protein n=1 Tax=Bartonella acomydis TaxID=686234 RepID=UPI0031EE6245